jgi:hypothetical protein
MPDFLSQISPLGNIPSGQDAVDALQTSSLNNITGIPGNPFSSNPLKSLGPTVDKLTAGSATSVAAAVQNTDNPVGSDGSIPQVVVPGTRPMDFRVRLSPQTLAMDAIYGPNDETNLLTPLRETRGLMFPFTPSIDWSQSVNYKVTSLVDSNQDYSTYENTPSTNLSVSGTFVIQNIKEAKYVLACIHFLRTVSKSYFGKASFKAPSTNEPSLAGLPPPILIFRGYGDYMFNDLPVIVKDHSYSFKQDVSYIDFEVNDSMVRLPSIMDISIKLVVQNTPKRNKDEFDLDKFRTGALMKNKGWI